MLAPALLIACTGSAAAERFVQTDEGVVASGSERRVSVEIITFSAEGPGTP